MIISKTIHNMSKYRIFKSLYFNKKYVKNKTKSNVIKLCKKTIHKIENGTSIINNGSLSINESRFNNKTYGYLYLSKNSKLKINGDFKIHRGCDIFLGENASLELGSGYIMDNLQIQCLKSVKIGNKVAISRNVVIRDSDSHQILNSNHKPTQSIEIGDHVWIGLNVTILKGVKIGNGAIIGAGSVVNKDIPENCLAVGVPAKVIKTNVKWE